MRNNHIPQHERLKAKVSKLQNKLDASRERTPGNPYLRCKGCGIRDPEVSIRNGKHYGDCEYAGLEAQIDYYLRLLYSQT